MSKLLKCTIPTWDNNNYDYNDATLDIKTSDSVIRIFGMLTEKNIDNEELMYKILDSGSETLSMPDLGRFDGGTHLDLGLVYRTWTNMETENNAPHIVLGIYGNQTYCAWIDSWTDPNTMTLSRIDPKVLNNRLWYLTKTSITSSLLALSMLNNTACGWRWETNIEIRSPNMHSIDILATRRYNLKPVPLNTQGRWSFDNWKPASILISLNDRLSYNLFDAQVSDPVLSSTGLSWVPRTSSTGETCTLAAAKWTETRQCTLMGSSTVWYKTTPYHPVSKMMDTNYKGVYTTTKKDTVFINGGSYKPTSLLKYTNQLLHIDLSTLITVNDFVFNITATDQGYDEGEHIFQYDFTVTPTTALSSKITLSSESATWSVTDYGQIWDARSVRFKVVGDSSFTSIDVEVKYECRDGIIIVKEITDVIIS